MKWKCLKSLLILPLGLLTCLTPAPSALAQEFCISPAEPYLYKVDKVSDREFYNFSRDEFQTYLEDMEKYLRCLEVERSQTLHKLGEHFNLFRRNFGSDGVFISDADTVKNEE